MCCCCCRLVMSVHHHWQQLDRRRRPHQLVHRLLLLQLHVRRPLRNDVAIPLCRLTSSRGAVSIADIRLSQTSTELCTSSTSSSSSIKDCIRLQKGCLSYDCLYTRRFRRLIVLLCPLQLVVSLLHQGHHRRRQQPGRPPGHRRLPFSTNFSRWHDVNRMMRPPLPMRRCLWGHVTRHCLDSQPMTRRLRNLEDHENRLQRHTR